MLQLLRWEFLISSASGELERYFWFLTLLLEVIRVLFTLISTTHINFGDTLLEELI